MSDAQMKQCRREAAHRRRRIIFNNDGSEWDYTRKPTAEEYLRINTTGLADSHVDAIFYSTTQHFNHFTHNSKVGELYEDPNDILKGLRDQGLDPLQIMIDFCREHDKEIFWSLRVNDEHDAWVVWGGEQWKANHPECLFGSRDNPPPHASWSCVDYAQQSVRDLLFDTIEDVCRRYDIDGIELDFFRQLHCFKKHAWGQPLGDEERDIMNEHMHRIRTMMDEVGKERGRPLLIAARVPDCPEYSRRLALDTEAWLEKDLLDLMVLGGYFWLRPWADSVELARKYDVPVYPSLDGSRVTDTETRELRRSDDAYRAHAANAWNSGVDGIYVFNLNYMRDPADQLWRQLGDPDALTELDKIYHLNVMSTGHPSTEFYLPGGNMFMTLPRLCPDHPLHVRGGQRFVSSLEVADDLTADDLEFTPRVTLNVKVTDLENAEQLHVKLNGNELARGPSTWRFKQPDDWLEFVAEPKTLKVGPNMFEIIFSAPTDNIICIVHDVHLRLEYGPGADRRRDLTMSRKRLLAYSSSLT